MQEFMEICFVSLNLSNSDIILIVTAIILLLTLVAMMIGNKENARLNRLQAAENTILKQLEFHNNLLKGIKINYESTGRGFGTPNAPVDACGQEAFELFYDILKQNYQSLPGNTYKGEFDVDAEERRIKDSFYQLYKAHGSLFGNYFKNLYLLVKYIYDKDAALKGFDRRYYIDLIKSQLSKYEILLLAYDCIWIQNKPKGENFIELARDSKLLSALETDELIISISKVTHMDIFETKYKITFGEPIEYTN
jgi:hypothetical protein